MKKLFMFIAAIMMVLFMIGTSCTCTKTYTIQYKVSGSAQAANISYNNENGGISNANNVILPWTYSFEAKEGDYISVNASKDDGSIIATIYKDGEVLESSSSTDDGWEVIHVSSIL